MAYNDYVYCEAVPDYRAKGDRNGESLLNNFSSVLLHSNSLAVATSPFLHLLYHQCNRGSSKQ